MMRGPPESPLHEPRPPNSYPEIKVFPSNKYYFGNSGRLTCAHDVVLEEVWQVLFNAIQVVLAQVLTLVGLVAEP